MSQAAKAQEPSMEEILASIRRIIADDDAGKPAKLAEPPKAEPPEAELPRPTPPKPAAIAPSQPQPEPPPAGSSQEAVDAMLADFDTETNSAQAEPPDPMSPPAVMPAPDVLELTEAMTAPEPTPTFRTIDAATDVVFADHPPEMSPEAAVRSVEAPAPIAAESPPRVPRLGESDPALLSSATAAAVDNAFNSLAHTVLGNNARTLEDLVKEMLRPMLKSWLDDNLPSLVERIVRAEIERVSRGRS